MTPVHALQDMPGILKAGGLVHAHAAPQAVVVEP